MPLEHVGLQVAQGALYLDEEHPGWREHINLRTLNISLAHLCVLGQLDAYERGLPNGQGNFYEYLARHGKSQFWAYAHGFLLTSPSDPFLLSLRQITEAIQRTSEWKVAIQGHDDPPQTLPIPTFVQEYVSEFLQHEKEQSQHEREHVTV